MRFLLPAALALGLLAGTPAAAQAANPALPTFDGVCNTLVFAGQSKTCSKEPRDKTLSALLMWPGVFPAPRGQFVVTVFTTENTTIQFLGLVDRGELARGVSRLYLYEVALLGDGGRALTAKVYGECSLLMVTDTIDCMAMDVANRSYSLRYYVSHKYR